MGRALVGGAGGRGPWLCRRGLSDAGAATGRGVSRRPGVRQPMGRYGLRELLVVGDIEAAGAARFSTHSMQATFLAWTAGFPLSPSDRRILGGAHKPGDRSVFVYSRDALVGPLRALGVVLNRVASGDYRPDAPRGLQHGQAADVEPSASDQGSGDEGSTSSSTGSEAGPPGPTEHEEEDEEEQGSQEWRAPASSCGSCAGAATPAAPGSDDELRAFFASMPETPGVASEAGAAPSPTVVGSDGEVPDGCFTFAGAAAPCGRCGGGSGGISSVGPDSPAAWGSGSAGTR